jgi:hypothetical protein
MMGPADSGRTHHALVRRPTGFHQIENHFEPGDHVARFQQLLLLFDFTSFSRSLQDENKYTTRRQVRGPTM